MAQQCPRCGSGVPDGRETCQVCNAPMNAPPEPAKELEEEQVVAPGIPGVDNLPKAQSPYPASPSAGRGDVRVALTGEVIETPASTAPGGGGPLPGTVRPPGAAPLSRPLPAASVPSTPYASPRRSVPAEAPRKSGGTGVVAAILILLLLLGGGAFGFWYWQKQRAPAIAAEKMLAAMKNKDWKTVYNAMEFSAEQKQVITEPIFVQAMNVVGGMFSVKEYKIGDVRIDGETATVQTEVTIEAAGRTRTDKNDAKFKLVDGQWKLDVAGDINRLMGSLSSGGGGPRGR